MGYIKEPDGIDLVINSRPLTKEDRVAITEFIKADKAKHRMQHTRKKYATA
jgi:hypothetical protein